MEELASLAELAVVLGANVQPGQVVRVTAAVEQVATVQAMADAAYRHGARFVEAQLVLPGLQRSLILNGPAEAYVPAWADAPVYGLDEAEGALIEVTGPRLPGLLDDLDPVLVNRVQPPFRKRRSMICGHDDVVRASRTLKGGCVGRSSDSGAV